LRFNWANFAAFARRALQPPPDSPYRLTPKRAAVLIGFLTLFGATEFATRLGYAIDALLYPEHRDLAINAPVFIIGNPRSGTTFFHRLLAQDTATFTTMHLWEILFATSITQRELVRRLSKLDNHLGGPFHHHIARLDARAAQSNQIHNAELLAPEEDQFLLLHIWSTLAIWHFSGILEEAGPYTHFDTAVPQPEQQAILSFYRQAIRRHLYADHLKGNPGRCYLAKNPSASPKVRALRDTFPDARFVYLVRNPLAMIPSMISCLEFTWQVLGDPPDLYTARDYVLDMAEHWYTYPLTQLDRLPKERYAIVRFETLTQHADQVVRKLYDRFGFEMGPDYATILDAEAAKARSYESSHRYELAMMSLSRDTILTRFATIFERFGFDTHSHVT
jgi:omega-hydroxy-beta-dihydromenaquinone-9 sulfotransferase